jgi:hypothetical protein
MRYMKMNSFPGQNTYSPNIGTHNLFKKVIASEVNLLQLRKPSMYCTTVEARKISLTGSLSNLQEKARENSR